MKLFSEPFVGLAVFSAIETVAVIAWLALLKVEIPVPIEQQVFAAVVLFVGYLVEHIVAFNVGKDRPYLSFPKR